VTFVAAHPLAKRCRECARLHFNAEQLRRYHARRARQRAGGVSHIVAHADNGKPEESE
jgi:hypothetical protein